jgi:DNA helicase-2/ATP-dependent DNA helicase PcrA
MNYKKISSHENININQNFLVSAGPGSGKTEFLVNHIHHIIKDSNNINTLRKILAITYTNVAADNLSRRLGYTSGFTYVSTIHSFLSEYILFPYSWLLEGKYSLPKKLTITPHQLASFSDFKKLCKKYHYQYMTYNHKIRERISSSIYFKKLSDHYSLTIDQKDARVPNEKYSIKNDSRFFMEYKQSCWKNGIINYDDVLLLSLIILENNPFVAKLISNIFPFIFIDEFQDTSIIQAEIISILADNGSKVGVIGDENQSIYGFAHSSQETFRKFSLPKLNKYCININHRSSDPIIKLLNRITENSGKDPQVLQHISGPKPTIVVGEPRSVVNWFLKNHPQNPKYSKMIISYSNDYIEQINPDYSAPSKEIKDNINKMRTDDRGRFIYNIIKSLKLASEGQINASISAFFHSYEKTNADEKYVMSKFYYAYNKFDDYLDNNISTWFNEFFLDKGIHEANSDNTSKIMTKITKGSKCFLGMKVKYLLSDVPIEGTISEFRTIHQSKGDEADAVLIMIDGTGKKKERNFSFLLSPKLSGSNEDDRVYYVAMSRAKHELFFSIPSLNKNIRKQIETTGLVTILDFSKI